MLSTWRSTTLNASSLKKTSYYIFVSLNSFLALASLIFDIRVYRKWSIKSNLLLRNLPLSKTQISPGERIAQSNRLNYLNLANTFQNREIPRITAGLRQRCHKVAWAREKCHIKKAVAVNKGMKTPKRNCTRRSANSIREDPYKLETRGVKQN